MEEAQKHNESTVAIKYCRCPHGQQDKMYGKNRRLHNRTKLKESKEMRGWRCTVCKDVKI